MTIAELQKKISPLLPKGKQPFKNFIREALVLKLQGINQKIAVFEGKYNKNFQQFRNEWQKTRSAKRYDYETEGDYVDWEALEEYKHDLMRTAHSL